MTTHSPLTRHKLLFSPHLLLAYPHCKLTFHWTHSPLTHHLSLQWSPPHSLTHSLTRHVTTYHPFTHSTNTRRALTLPPFTHTLTMHPYIQRALTMHSRTHHALTHYILSLTHTLHAITTQLLNHHSLVTFSPCTHPLTPWPRTHHGASYPTLTHSPGNHAPATHAHSLYNHVPPTTPSHTQQKLSHQTNTHGALASHSCSHRPQTHAAHSTHPLTTHSPNLSHKPPKNRHFLTSQILVLDRFWPWIRAFLAILSLEIYITNIHLFQFHLTQTYE